MIDSVTISNFLSHKDTTIEFSPGVNIIVGPTDSGKSAIVKALRWAITNRPMGDGMRSSWGGLTSVAVLVNDQTVLRQRDQGLNQYVIGNHEFNAIKGDVPAEILQLLNLTDINLQTQFDSHFLLSRSPGEVAQTFNKVAHLDKIDIALQNIQRGSREAYRKLEYDKEALKDKEERLLAYDNLPEIEGLIKALEDKESILQSQALKRQEVIQLISAIKRIEDELAEIEFLGDLDKTVVSVLDNINRLKVFEIERGHLRNHIESLEDIGEALVEVEVLVLMEQKVDHILEVMKQQTKLKEQERLLNGMLTKLDHLNEGLDLAEKAVQELEKQFHEELGEGNICPLCEQVIK